LEKVRQKAIEALKSAPDDATPEELARLVNETLKVNFDCPFCERPTTLVLNEPLPDLLDSIEKQIVIAALEQTHNNQTYAAQRLKIPFHAIRHLIKKHGLKK
jgi:DNA-binding NtrC family response regulator